MAGPALIDSEVRYRRAALPLVSVAPRVPGLATLVRGSATMFTDDPDEKFAAGIFLYVEGKLVWEAEVPGLDYFHAAQVRVPDAEAPSEPGLLFIYATKQAYLDGTRSPRAPGFEESWVFLVSEGTGELAVSVPAVPYIGSRKKGIDHKFQCFAGVRLVPGEWSSTAYVLNPYPDPIELRCWLQAPRGQLVEVLTCPVPPRSVRALDLLDLAAAAGDPRRFDYGTLIVWGSLKPQGYVAIQGPNGRTRAMDHFNPFWG